MKYSKEFTEAISNLSPEEKDKLILRLLKKDLPLTKKLHHDLLNDKSVDEQRADLTRVIQAKCKQVGGWDMSPGYMGYEIKAISGSITEYLRLTKDKYGEVSLNLEMLNAFLEYNSKQLGMYTPGDARKFSIYIITRTYKIMLLIQKLHPDYFIDFKESLNTLGEHIKSNIHLERTAKQHALNTEWLLKSELPDDLIALHKALKQSNYLGNKVYLRTPDFKW